MLDMQAAMKDVSFYTFEFLLVVGCHDSLSSLSETNMFFLNLHATARAYYSN